MLLRWVVASSLLAACSSSHPVHPPAGDAGAADSAVLVDLGPVDAALPVACTPSGAPAAGAAIIFQAPSPVAPGETALLFGAHVGTSATVTGVRIDDSVADEPPRIADCVPATATSLTVLEATDLSVKATIPSAWTAGLYALIVTNASGASAPVVLNRPRIDWIHSGVGGTVVSGATVDIYGRSFGTQPNAWLVDSTGKATALTAPLACTSDGYAATFNVPTLTAGAYQLYVHSGKGGPYGFSDPLAVSVVAPTPWPTTVYPIAAGSGNDDSAVAAAIAKAKAGGGGIVEFAKGSYTLTQGVDVPAKTVVRSATGVRTDVTIAFNEKAIPFPFGFEGDGNFTIESITVTSSTSARLFQCPTGADFLRDPSTGGPQYQPDAPCSNATLHDVSFTLTTLRDLVDNGTQTTTPTSTILAVLDGNDSEISDSTLTNEGGGALTIANANRDYIMRNTLVSGTTRVSAQATMPLSAAESAVGGGDGTFGMRDSAIVGNTIGPSPKLGAAATMFIEYDAHDLYIADNKIGPNLSDYGEGFSFDAPYYPLFLGMPKSVSGKTMTIPNVLNAAGKSVFAGVTTGLWPASSMPSTTNAQTLSGSSVVVVNGTGLGQYAEVVSNAASAADGSTQLTLDREFVVPLDSTSIVEIAVIKSKVVFARNAFHDVAVGGQLYAGGYDFIVDGTTGNAMEGTYCYANDFMSQRSSATDLQRRFSRCYFVQWLNTTLTNQVDSTFPWAEPSAGQGVSTPYVNGLIGGQMGIGADPLIPPQRGMGLVGNIIRNNQVGEYTFGFVHHGTGGTLPKPLPTFGRDNIIEDNTTKSVPIGVFVDTPIPDTLIRNDTCTSCDAGVVNLNDGG